MNSELVFGNIGQRLEALLNHSTKFFVQHICEGVLGYMILYVI